MLDIIIKIITGLVALSAFGLSLLNARATWWRPFRFEIYPLNKGIIENTFNRENFVVSLRISATFINVGSKPGLIQDVALVQLDQSMNIIEKFHWSLIKDDEAPNLRQFNGLFLKAGQTHFCDAIFEGVIRGKQTQDIEDWNLVYKLTTGNYYRLSNTIISVDLKNLLPDDYRPQEHKVRNNMKIKHVNPRNRKILDTLPEIDTKMP